MTTTLSLDISSKCTGYAVFTNGGLNKKALGNIKLNHKTHGEKLNVFESELTKLLKAHKPSTVIIEDIYKSRNVRTYRVLSYYHGVAYKAIYKYKKIEPVILTVKEIRTIIGQEYGTNLMPTKRQKNAQKINKDSKELTFDLMKKIFALRKFNFVEHNDIVDAIAVGLAHQLFQEGKHGSLQSIGNKPRRKRKRSKKSV